MDKIAWERIIGWWIVGLALVGGGLFLLEGGGDTNTWDVTYL